MDARWLRLTGVAAILGSLLAVLANVPTTWYGLVPRDSYVFNPPVMSPLWINRTVVPILAVVAILGLLAGMAGLVRRDWPVAGRTRRYGGIGAILGLAGATVAVPLLLWGFQDPRQFLVTIGGLALAGLSLLVLVPSLLALGYGYARTDRPVLGYLLAAIVGAVPLLGIVIPGPLQAMAGAMPIAVAWGVVGLDLVRFPEPLTSSVRDRD